MLSPESSCGSASRYTRAGLELDFIDLAEGVSDDIKSILLVCKYRSIYYCFITKLCTIATKYLHLIQLYKNSDKPEVPLNKVSHSFKFEHFFNDRAFRITL
jgi:hypothetical protein